MESIAFTLYHRRLLAILIALFCFMVSLNFHGYSFSAWHSFIDASPASEVLFGRPRMVRGDDYFLDLPSAIAQTQAIPSYPLLNTNIGTGQFMVAPIKVPVRHPLELFRPSTWGYFMSPDIGMSWNWWFGILGLFYGSFLLFLIVSKGDFWLSLIGSLLLVNSPFFQCWSFHKVEIFVHSLYLVVFLLILLQSNKPWQIWASGLMSGWSASCFIFDHMYPPFQITLAFVLCCIFIWVISEFKIPRHFKRHYKIRLSSTFIALIIFSSAVFLFLKDCSETLTLINKTLYPGQRFSIGGGGNLWTLFNNHFFSLAGIKTWNPLVNPSEAGHFFYFSPLVFLIWLFNFKKLQGSKLFVLPLFFLSFFLLIFYLFGLPLALSKYSMLYKVTSNRLGMAFGFINGVILIYFGAQRRRFPDEFKNNWPALLLWTAFLIYIAFQLKFHIPEMKTWFLTVGLLVNVALSYLLVIHKNPLNFFQILACLSIAFTFSFNPITRGGTDFVLNNPLSKEIKRINASQLGKTRWLTLVPNTEYYGYTSLIRMLGVPSFDGHHGHPHFDLWTKINPSGEFRNKFNQLGYVSFIPTGESELRIDSSGPGKIEVFIPDNLEILRNIGITHILFLDRERNAFSPHAKFKEVYRYAHWKIFENIHETPTF